MPGGGDGGGQDIVVCYDYQCPYSARAVRWLEGLAEGVVRPRYRMFSLEQVNVDRSATEWRLWDQPLDYEHHRGRSTHRSLPAFLLTAILADLVAAGAEDPAVLRAFRLAVYAARFDAGRDISQVDELVGIAVAAGSRPALIEAALEDPSAQAQARGRIAADWHAVRSQADVFGVPTLILPGDRPVYMRLARELGDDEASDLLRRLVELRRAAPWLLELKLAEASAG